MQTRISALVFGAVLALSLVSQVHAGRDYSALLQASLSAVDWEFQQRYAFTESSSEDDVDIAARFDPRRPEGSRWQLLRIDGRRPSDQESADFSGSRGEYDIEMGTDNEGGLLELVDLETVKLKKETDTHWVLAFRPSLIDEDDDKEAQKVFKKLRGEAFIDKKTGHIESLTMKNKGAIRPVIGAKISKMIMHFGFTSLAENDANLLSEVEVTVKGSALMMIRFNEQERFRYSDFELVSQAR